MRPLTKAAIFFAGAVGFMSVGAAIAPPWANATTCSYKPWADAHPELCSTTTVPPTLPPLTTAPATTTTVPATTTTVAKVHCDVGSHPPLDVPAGTPCPPVPPLDTTMPYPSTVPCHPAPGSQDQYCDAPTTAPTVAPVADSPGPTALPTPGPARSAPPATASVVALHNLPATGTGDVLLLVYIGLAAVGLGLTVIVFLWMTRTVMALQYERDEMRDYLDGTCTGGRHCLATKHVDGCYSADVTEWDQS